jgi:hypothetical protein
MLRHQLQRLVEILPRVDGDEVDRGDVLHLRGLGILPLRDHADRDVAVRDCADESVALDDRREADVLVAQHLRGVGHRLVGVDRAGVPCHQILDALPHLTLLFTALK